MTLPSIPPLPPDSIIATNPKAPTSNSHGLFLNFRLISTSITSSPAEPDRLATSSNRPDLNAGPGPINGVTKRMKVTARVPTRRTWNRLIMSSRLSKQLATAPASKTTNTSLNVQASEWSGDTEIGVDARTNNANRVTHLNWPESISNK